DRNRSHWSTSKTPSYTKSVSWQHHPPPKLSFSTLNEYFFKRYNATINHIKIDIKSINIIPVTNGLFLLNTM
ncbi:hypothetical protein P2R24_23670, partial [Escherichia coli]